MKYWLMRGKKPDGPYEPAELLHQEGFAAECLVCPGDRPPSKPKNWRVAKRVKELAPWLKELEARAKATGLPWEAERTRVLGGPPPAQALPSVDAARRFERPKIEVAPEPELPEFRRRSDPVSNLAAGVVAFTLILCVGTLAMLLSGRCSGEPPARKAPAMRRAPYVVPAPP